MLELGTEIERYTIESLLGQGGMATVYKARHSRLGSLHAVKILEVPGQSIRSRLLQEGQVQATLRHRNVVAVTDVLEHDGAPCLVMEFVDGPSLDQWLARNEPDMGQAVDIFRGIVRGVRAAHRRGLIHRDLKPANVLMETTEDGLVPKVTDFGVAKAMEAPLAGAKTRTGSAMGTPEYQAPEQIRDASSVDQRADLFSLGAILYELVCCRRAFGGRDLLEIYNAVANTDYVPVHELVPEVPDPIRDVIEGCLTKEPEGRIASCDLVLQHLDRIDRQAMPARTAAPVRVSPNRTAADPTQAPPPDTEMGAGRTAVPEEAGAYATMAELAVPEAPPAAPLPLAAQKTAPGAVDTVPVPSDTVPDASTTLLPPLATDEPRGSFDWRVPVGAIALVGVAGLAIWSQRGPEPPPVEIPVAQIPTVEPPSPSVEPLPAEVVPEPKEVLAAEIEEKPEPLHVKEPTKKPEPKKVAPRVVKKRVGTVAKTSSFAGWLNSHDEWLAEAAKAAGKGDSNYLKGWTESSPPEGAKSALVNVSWAAAQAYCSARGGLADIDAKPHTWTESASQPMIEWRVDGGKPAWRQFDGATSTKVKTSHANQFTGLRCTK